MDKLTEAMHLIHDIAIKGKGRWEGGAKEAFVFNDAVIVVSMSEDRTLKFEVIAGVPQKFDLALELLEADDRS